MSDLPVLLAGTNNIYNFGSLLTNFALWKAVSDLGYRVNPLPYPKSRAHEIWWAGAEKFAQQLEKEYIKDWLPFLNNFHEINALLGEHAGILLTGSDQVFRPDYLIYDLADLRWADSSAIRICYASSFGIDKPDTESPFMFDHIIGAIAKFDKVSIRESIHVDLLKTYGIHAVHTVEPVLLYDASFWIKYAEKQNTKEHIFAYILDPNPEVNLLLGFARGKLGCCVEQFGEMWMGGSIGERLGSIANAKFVVTDSFHGMCFAIIFRKPFIAIVNHTRGASRFTDMVKKLHLESRLVESAGEVLARPTLFEPFDWSECEKELNGFREFSFNWLKEAICWAQINEPDILKKERIINDNLIWYGAGMGAKRLLLFIKKLGLPFPKEIWDRDAWYGRELEGIPVNYPNYESLRGRSDVQVVITIENAKTNDEVSQEMRTFGFANVTKFEEIDFKYRMMLRKLHTNLK